MDFEEKMFLRFQKEKVIKTRKRGFANLDDNAGEETLLTHKGEALGASNASGFVGDEDDVSSPLADLGLIVAFFTEVFRPSLFDNL